MEAAQTVEKFMEALERAKAMISEEFGIRELQFIRDDGNSFVIGFTVSNHPFPPFRMDSGYGLTKKAGAWTAEEIVGVIVDFAQRVRS